jgi:hypothetical protein
MHTTRYKIWQWIEDPTGDGSNVQYNVAISTKAKRSNVNPYEISNELLCLRLGLAMNLPVPLGVILEKDGKTYYASLHVAIAGEKLPPATEEDLNAIASDERLTCGIVMFDSWILNEDRCSVNISYFDDTKQTFIFDHGRAFLDKTGRAFLEANKNEICIGEHCLAERIKSLWSFDDWHRTMLSIPEHYIRDSVEMASTLGLPEEDIDFCTQYLIDRRNQLRELFIQHRKKTFPNLDEGLLDPLIGIPVEYQI